MPLQDDCGREVIDFRISVGFSSACYLVCLLFDLFDFLDGLRFSLHRSKHLCSHHHAAESLVAAVGVVVEAVVLDGKPQGKGASVFARPAKAAKKRGKRGALKESVLAALKEAGKKGTSVKELSSKLGVKNQNLHVWFHTAGKTIKGLKRSGPGQWVLV